MPFFGGGGGDYHIVATNINGGTDALPAVTGSNNMALGNGAGQFTTTGDSNIFIGNYAGNENVTGSALTVIGQYDSISNITAMDNSVIIGAHLLDFYASASVSQSTVIGANNNLFTPELTTFSASNSVAVLTPLDGSSTFLSTFDLTNSVVIGQSRTYDPGIGGTHVNTVIIGSCASHGLTGSVFVGPGLGVGGIAGAGNNCVVIGADINVTVNNAIIIGDSSHTSVTIGGVTLSSATGSVFPSAIIGDPGTEGTGIVIGGVTYDALLKVSDISSADIAQSIIHRHSTTWEPIQVFARSNSNGSGHGAVVNSLAISSQYSAGWTGTEYNLFSRIHTEAAPTGTISDASSPGDIVFSTTPDGGTVPVEAMRISQDKSVTVSGGFGFGVTTFGALPAAASNTGKVYRISDVGTNGSFWFSDGVEWLPLNGAITLGNNGTASGIAPTGTVAANGALTLGTALNITYNQGIFLYFPAGAVYAGSLAGSYWCVMSSTTLGTIYDDTLGAGWPADSVPAVPTPIVAAGPGAYTGATIEVTLCSLAIPAGVVDGNGALRSWSTKSVNNTANNKTFREKVGAVAFEASNLLNTVCNISLIEIFARNGTAAIIKPASSTSFGNFGGSPAQLAVNLGSAFTYSITGTLATATDTFVLEGNTLELKR